MKKILIIGANGFLGNCLSKKCVDLGWSVDGVIHKSSDNLAAGINEVVPVTSISKLNTNKYDYVFNVAAFIPYGAYNTPDKHILETNIELVLTINKNFPAAKVIFASSVAAYGTARGVTNEKTECISSDIYGLSKLCGELITKHQTNYAIVRFSSLYGKGMYQDTFIPRMINDAKNKKMITLFGDGERKQNYLHVQDAAGYCINAALYGSNDVYLGVSSSSYKNIEIAGIVATNTNNSSITYTGFDDSPSFVYDNKHTQDVLKYTPAISIENGLKELINE